LIGILGGTFDPIHNGHIHIATEVHTRLRLAQLQLMPCALPVHRDLPQVSAQHRTAMIGLAIDEQPGFLLNPLELDRDGPSYSIESLRQIRQQEGSALVLVLGADAFNGFDGWKQPQEILRLANVVVCCRPGYQLDQTNFDDWRVDSVREFSSRTVGAILTLEVDAIDCSSSAVRASLNSGTTSRQYLHPAVADYINEHNLYRKQGD
jgi:nicotinate-nucleotide adenylyltransferase